MSPSQWNRVSDLFASVLELDTSARSRLLAGEEEETRREVERLLGEHRRSGRLDRLIVAESAEPQYDRRSGNLLRDRYRIERFLARGGAGTVYLARDGQVAGRAVVVKFLDSYSSHDTWLRKKFREEMEALARIDHRGVVGILDAGETPDGVPFLVIEYIDGVTLRSEIEKGPMSLTRVARLIREIGGAVSAAHEKGVLHRDLKPENIMLERAGTPGEMVRLIDFGIARIDRPDQEVRTQTTRFAGTTLYMAPEQLAGRPEAASDIYAMGVLAYEMLSGRRPFLAATPVELYEQQRAGLKEAKNNLLLTRPEIPPSVVHTILKPLSFRPEDRIGSALEASEQIATALEGRLPDIWSRRRIAGVLAGGAGLAASGVYGWLRTTRPLDPGERVIELPMGTEPLEHGFRKSLDIDYHALSNADATGYDSMRVISQDQGGYYHKFNAIQAHQAQLKGWKLTMEAAVEEGTLYSFIDNPRSPARFAVNLVRNPDQTDSAECVIVAAPSRRTISRFLPGPSGARHQLVLHWTPSTGAELWSDGVRLIAGYKGEPDFRYDRGLEFGACRNRSQRGSGIFWKLRVEIA